MDTSNVKKTGPEIPEWQKQEVRKRLKDYREGKSPMYSWESIKRELDEVKKR
jgi:hypothetical protein